MSNVRTRHFSSKDKLNKYVNHFKGIETNPNLVLITGVLPKLGIGGEEDPSLGEYFAVALVLGDFNTSDEWAEARGIFDSWRYISRVDGVTLSPSQGNRIPQ